MTLLPINGWLMMIVSLTALAVIFYWWIATRGSWMEWPAGRALMGLLGIIVIISGWAAINTLWLQGPYPAKVYLYFALYTALEVSLLVIGITIKREMRRGRQRRQAKSEKQTGPITVVVASTAKEDL